MPDNAADRKDIRRREKQAKLDARSRAEVVHSLMSTTQGREWMWDKLATARVFSSTFNGDALQSAFNEGQRAFGLAMLAEVLSTCPDEFIQAQREANVRSTTNERRSSPVPERGDTGPVDDSTDNPDSDDSGYNSWTDPDGNRHHPYAGHEA